MIKLASSKGPGLKGWYHYYLNRVGREALPTVDLAWRSRQEEDKTCPEMNCPEVCQVGELC